MTKRKTMKDGNDVQVFTSRKNKEPEIDLSKIEIPKSELLTLEEIQKLLVDRRLYVVAKATGLTYPTIRKLATGTGKNYTYDTMTKITKYFKPEFDDFELKNL